MPLATKLEIRWRRRAQTGCRAGRATTAADAAILIVRNAVFALSLPWVIGCARVEIPQFEAVDLNPTHGSHWVVDKGRIEELHMALRELPGEWNRETELPDAGYLVHLRVPSGTSTRLFIRKEWVAFEQGGVLYVKPVSPEASGRILRLMGAMRDPGAMSR